MIEYAFRTHTFPQKALRLYQITYKIDIYAKMIITMSLFGPI